nr:zinc finger, CCHC-type [Tanacetum cinerariifolium]
MDKMNFTRWKEKMKFLLTAFKVYYVLEGPPVGVMTEKEPRKHEQDETLCSGYILSTLTDRLYDLYTPMTSAREIYDSLEEKYTAEKEGAHNFTTFKFFEFAMEDNVKKLIHTLEDFTLDQIQKHLRNEEETRMRKKNLNGASSSRVNYVDSEKNNEGNNKKRKDLESTVIVESRDVDFSENKFHHDSTSTNEIVTQIPQDILGKNLISFNKRNMAKSSSAPRRSERARKDRKLDLNFIDSQAIIFLVESDNENNVVNKIPVLLNVKDAPKTYKEAIASRNSAFLKDAIDDEIDSLVSNNTWELLNLPPGSKAIGCRWVFRIKYHIDGSIQTFKATLVIQVFSQIQGIDYFDAYAPVARITLIRLIFALASIYNLPMHQMDVKTAFLNGDLVEEVYMKQSEGFVLPGHENKVCKLKKFLYGLKQAPKQWHDKFDKSILSNGFTHNSSDRCINETKKFLSLCFQMKEMNEVDTILRIKVKRHSGGYALNQCHYNDKIIDKFQHLNIEKVNTPYESSFKLVENNERAVAQIEYASAIDASWITSSSDSKSTTGWIFTLGGGAVCWG